MANKKHKPDPEILALMSEEEREKLLHREAEPAADERKIAKNHASNEAMNERQMISQIMARPSWLRQKDLEFVKSVFQQLEEGRRTELSEKQAMVIRDIYERWQKNQEPHFVQDGSPGGGKRR